MYIHIYILDIKYICIYMYISMIHMFIPFIPAHIRRGIIHIHIYIHIHIIHIYSISIIHAYICICIHIYMYVYICTFIYLSSPLPSGEASVESSGDEPVDSSRRDPVESPEIIIMMRDRIRGSEKKG
jgi:hypothetical protein